MAPRHLPVVVNCSINIVSLSGTDIGSPSANVSRWKVLFSLPVFFSSIALFGISSFYVSFYVSFGES
jgi:hypothetical protein